MSKIHQTVELGGTGDLNKTIVVCLFILVVILWLGSAFTLRALYPASDSRGTFGDSFGAINALFSGLAFAGIIVAILLQRNELRLQRQELELTRTELARSASAQESVGNSIGEQAMVMRVTAHLNALTALLRLQTEEIDGIKKGHVAPGDDAQMELVRLQKSRKDSIRDSKV
jgi:hypothetical protein